MTAAVAVSVHDTGRATVGAAIAAVVAARLQIAMVLGFTALYCTVSIRAQLLGRSHAFDLGIFTQGVQGYAAGTGPLSAIKGTDFSLLGDHFSPVIAMIAPFYALFPTPITLLVAQALLVAVSCVPIAGLFRGWFGRRVAVLATLSYGLSFGVAQAIGYDFHEVAFGAPLLAFALAALARRRVVATIVWTAPLVLVKEDLGFTVAAVGVVLALVTGRRRVGAALAAFGLLATAIEVKLVVPAFNPSGHYAYSSQITGVGGAVRAFATGLDIKALTVLCLVATAGFVCLRSPIMLVVLPTLAWRFVSTNVNYWGMGFHYGLLLMPIAFVALADGLRRLVAAGRLPVRLTTPMVAWSLAVSLLLIPTTPFFSLLRPTDWQRTPAEAAVQRAIAHIPSGSTVSASDTIVPQIVTRTTVWALGWPSDALDRKPEWVVVDTTSPSFFVPADLPSRLRLIHDVIERDGWHEVSVENGVYLLKR